jgi:hypothetical protein
MRGRACIGNRTRGHEPRRYRRGRTVEGMESPRPPFAPAVWIGAELEEHVSELDVVLRRIQRRRIEAEYRFVDGRAYIFVAFEEPAYGRGVFAVYCALELFERRQ